MLRVRVRLRVSVRVRDKVTVRLRDRVHLLPNTPQLHTRARVRVRVRVSLEFEEHDVSMEVYQFYQKYHLWGNSVSGEAMRVWGVRAIWEISVPSA